jgi:cyanate permease
MDPITLMAAASTAFTYLKKGIEVGKELSDMGAQLGSWANAISDLDFMAAQAQNPPWWKSMTGSAQADAIEVFAAKQKALAMRAELKQYIQYAYGQYKWEEFVSLEGKMRKQRQDHEHRKQEIRNSIINWIVGLFFGTIGLGLIIFLTWFSWTNKAI